MAGRQASPVFNMTPWLLSGVEEGDDVLTPVAPHALSNAAHVTTPTTQPLDIGASYRPVLEGGSCQCFQLGGRINGEVGGHDLPVLRRPDLHLGDVERPAIGRTVPLGRPHWIT
jgi:hypothetical protein